MDTFHVKLSGHYIWHYISLVRRINGESSLLLINKDYNTVPQNLYFLKRAVTLWRLDDKMKDNSGTSHFRLSASLQ